MKYDNTKIAQELQDTALGIGYHGNALRVAKDFSCLTAEDRSILDAYLTGRHDRTVFDRRMRLQDIAIKIREIDTNESGGKTMGLKLIDQ